MLLVLLPKYTLNPSTSSRFCHQLNMMEKCLSCYSLRTKVLWIILMPEVCCFIFSIFSLLLFSCSFVPDSLWPHGLQYARLPGPSPAPRVCANSCPLNLWCYPAISSSVIPFSSCLQPFPGSGSFPMSQLFPSGGLGIGALASASALPVNIQGWFPLGLTDLISLLTKGLLRFFSSTTVPEH